MQQNLTLIKLREEDHFINKSCLKLGKRTIRTQQHFWATETNLKKWIKHNCKVLSKKAKRKWMIWKSNWVKFNHKVRKRCRYHYRQLQKVHLSINLQHLKKILMNLTMICKTWLSKSWSNTLKKERIWTKQETILFKHHLHWRNHWQNQSSINQWKTSWNNRV